MSIPRDVNPDRYLHDEGWFARARYDGSGLIVCPWVRVYVNPVTFHVEPPRSAWHWPLAHAPQRAEADKGGGCAVILRRGGKRAAINALEAMLSAHRAELKAKSAPR
jgi:hypothetical protein